MAGDEKKPLFVFRRRSAHLANDSSGDFAADIEEITETTFCVIDEGGNRHQLQKKEYLLFNNEHVQYVLVDVHLDQSRWLLVDSWKQREGLDYEIAFYDADAIGEATAEAKRRNATTVHPTLEQTLARIRQKMEEIRRYQQDERKEMKPFASPPGIVHFSVSNHLATHTLDWLEHDLLHFFPGTRRVAVYEDHCDWEGAFCGEIWNQERIWFRDRYREHVKVSINPPDPRLDMDIYNVGLLMSPALPLYLPLKDARG